MGFTGVQFVNGIYNDLIGLMIVIQWDIVMGYTLW
jgi:hypothetical protein